MKIIELKPSEVEIRSEMGRFDRDRNWALTRGGGRWAKGSILVGAQRDAVLGLTKRVPEVAWQVKGLMASVRFLEQRENLFLQDAFQIQCVHCDTGALPTPWSEHFSFIIKHKNIMGTLIPGVGVWGCFRPSTERTMIALCSSRGAGSFCVCVTFRVPETFQRVCQR